MEKKRVRILSLREMFDKIFDIHRKTIGSSLPYIIIMQIIMGIGIFLCTLVLIVPFISMSVVMDDVSGLSFFLIILIIGIILLTFFSKNLLTAGLMKIGSDGYFGNRTKFSNGISFAFSKFGKMMGVSFAEAIILGLWLVPVFIMFYLFGLNDLFKGSYLVYEGVDSLNNPKFIIGSMIFLAIIAGIIILVFSTLYALVVPVAIYENLGMFKAMKRSRKLVIDYFWGVMGKKLLLGLVVQGVSSSLISILGIIGAVAMFLLRNSMTSEGIMNLALVTGNLLRYPVQLLLASCITPITSLFVLVLYYNLKFKKEGYDFEVNIFFMDKEKGSIENVQ
ncbi:hypothetical protein [Oceanirhabdus sp. W0125-5]|uniref:hypothetical protein n=1 Tax=Oceanirhabdus sp. W0125-5 TaxID=2999116 RepID=UPI0022F2EC62|nr:hypothetical protein [Oceanirhabdus sp. W0125-5]WBW95978.1 hypothetical protein OW730_20130 [Oceanirhabdus sp. W0125-5]